MHDGYVLFMALASVCVLGCSVASAQSEIDADNPAFQYSGRIDATDVKHPKLNYAGSYIRTRFEGTSLKAKLSDHGWGSGNFVGFLIDKAPVIVKELQNGKDNQVVEVATGLAEGTHDLVIIKRTSLSYGHMGFRGLILDAGKGLKQPDAKPTRKIELFGDSVTEGENAAWDGTEDKEGGRPCFDGWSSYGMIMARKLNAECYNNGLGGLSVQDGKGWWDKSPTTSGWEFTVDKTNAIRAMATPWDLSRFTPQLVICAFGINDGSTGALKDKDTWKAKYKEILTRLQKAYPKAVFVLTTPRLNHDSRADEYQAQIAQELGPSFHAFKFTGRGTNHHPGKIIHEEMAEQMAKFVETLKIDW